VARGREGLSEFPESECGSDSAAVLQLSRDGGLGTIFIAVMVVARCFCGEGNWYDREWILWMLMLCVPLLHCEHGGMDDGGVRAAALADP